MPKNLGYYLIIVFLALACVFTVFLIFNSSSKLAPVKTSQQIIPQITSPERPEKTIAVVGEENIYKADFDYILKNNFGNTLTKQVQPEAEIRKEITDILIEESAVLQAGQKEGLIKLDPTIYNNFTKDLVKRKAEVEKVKKQVQDRSSKVSVSMLSVWYYDVYPPQIPEEEAKVYAQTFINSLYVDIKNGKMTLEQAAEKIKTDPKMPAIDISYKSNAFFMMVDKPWEEILPQHQNAIKDLKVGEYSPVIQMKNQHQDREEYFTVYRLDAKSGEGLYSDWIKKAISDLKIIRAN